MSLPTTIDETSQKEIESLQGVWRTVTVEVDGSPVAHHHFENATLAIAGGRFILHNPVPDADQRTEGSFRVDAAAHPKRLLLMLDNGQIIQEIYELDQDTLKVCYPTREGSRATAFKTEPQSGLSIVIYRRDTKI